MSNLSDIEAKIKRIESIGSSKPVKAQTQKDTSKPKAYGSYQNFQRE